MSDPLHDPYSSPSAPLPENSLPSGMPERKLPAWRCTPGALVGNIWGGAMLLAVVTCAIAAIGEKMAGLAEGAIVIIGIGWILFPVVCIRGMIPLFRRANPAERAGMVASVIFAPIAAYFIVGMVAIFVLRIGIC